METQTKLRKKSLKMVEEAIAQVSGFKELYQEFEDKVLISDHSPSALGLFNGFKRGTPFSIAGIQGAVR